MTASNRNNTRKSGPGKAHRIGISLIELAKMFPDDEVARLWFEEIFWPEGNRYCPRCDSERTRKAKHPTMPYWCSDCRKYFSVKTGTVMEGSKVGYQKWAFGVYVMVTNIKGTSSMKLHAGSGRKATDRVVSGAPDQRGDDRRT